MSSRLQKDILNVNERVSSFASAMLRNKVVFSTNVVDGLDYIDIGKRLSEELVGIEETVAKLKAAEILKSLVVQSVRHHQTIGKYIAMCNIGIIFEPDLHINNEQFLQSISSDTMLFVACQHTIVENTFLFMNSQDCKVNLHSLSHISI